MLKTGQKYVCKKNFKCLVMLVWLLHRLPVKLFVMFTGIKLRRPIVESFVNQPGFCAALHWVFLYLSTHQDVQDRCWEEINQVRLTKYSFFKFIYTTSHMTIRKILI